MQMEEKVDPEWYQKLVRSIKFSRNQKLGTLKDQVQKSHLKAKENKNMQINHRENIKSSINKALLNWIDPEK